MTDFNALLRDAPLVMGVLNVTPDSFSDGGEFTAAESAVAHASMMRHDGAAIIDIGGESTRPGALAVDEAEELARVLPAIEAVSGAGGFVSIDTKKATVMRRAVAAGARMINDVAALQAPGALDAAANAQVPVCLMHMQGTPETMQQAPSYDSIVDEVRAFFERRVRACHAAGIPDANIILDPGFGFGKTLAHNIELFQAIGVLCSMGYPLLVGVSRKSMLGTLLDQPNPKLRVDGGLAAASLAIAQGAAMIRTHDVPQTRDAIRVAVALGRKSTRI